MLITNRNVTFYLAKGLLSAPKRPRFGGQKEAFGKTADSKEKLKVKDFEMLQTVSKMLYNACLHFRQRVVTCMAHKFFTFNSSFLLFLNKP